MCLAVTCSCFSTHWCEGSGVSVTPLPPMWVDSLYSFEQFSLGFHLHPCVSAHFCWIAYWMENKQEVKQCQQSLIFTLLGKMKPPLPLEVIYQWLLSCAITPAAKVTLQNFLHCTQRHITKKSVGLFFQFPGFKARSDIKLSSKRVPASIKKILWFPRLFLKEHDHSLSASLKSVDQVSHCSKLVF